MVRWLVVDGAGLVVAAATSDHVCLGPRLDVAGLLAAVVSGRLTREPAPPVARGSVGN